MIADEAALEDLLSRPDDALREDLAAAPGDILVLGAAGKMGPTLCRAAKRADPARRVIAVARWSEPGLRQRMQSWGIETLSADLMDSAALAALPEAPNLIFLAARKFGSTGAEDTTWAMNTLLPAMVAERFPAATPNTLLVAGAVGRTGLAQREARLARSCGYHAVLLSLAAWKGASEDEMIAHCQAVAAEMPLFGFYLQPAVGGVVLSAGFWKRFASIDNVVAIKIAPSTPAMTTISWPISSPPSPSPMAASG